MAVNTFPEVHTVTELYPAYNDTLSAELHVAQTALSGLVDWNTPFQTSGMELGPFLSQHAQQVGDTLSDQATRTRGIISSMPERVLGLSDLSAADRRLLGTAQKDYSLYSSVSTLEAATTRSGLLVMRAALDARVLREAEKDYSLYSAEQTIQFASGDIAARGMRGVVDTRVYKEARKDYSLYDSTETIKHGSTRAARDAMRGGLDAKVFVAVSKDYSLYSARNTLEHGSDNVTPGMATEFLKPKFTKELIAEELSVQARKFGQRYDIPHFVRLGEKRTTTADLEDCDRTTKYFEDELSGLGRFAFIKKKKARASIRTMQGYRETLQQSVDWYDQNGPIVSEWEAVENGVRAKFGDKTPSGDGDADQDANQQYQGTWLINDPKVARPFAPDVVREVRRDVSAAMAAGITPQRLFWKLAGKYQQHNNPEYLQFLNTALRNKAANRGDAASGKRSVTGS